MILLFDTISNTVNQLMKYEDTKFFQKILEKTFRNGKKLHSFKREHQTLSGFYWQQENRTIISNTNTNHIIVLIRHQITRMNDNEDSE